MSRVDDFPVSNSRLLGYLPEMAGLLGNEFEYHWHSRINYGSFREGIKALGLAMQMNLQHQIGAHKTELMTTLSRDLAEGVQAAAVDRWMYPPLPVVEIQTSEWNRPIGTPGGGPQFTRTRTLGGRWSYWPIQEVQDAIPARVLEVVKWVSEQGVINYQIWVAKPFVAPAVPAFSAPYTRHTDPILSVSFGLFLAEIALWL